MRNSSSLLQTENDSVGFQRNNMCGVFYTDDDNVGQTDKRCGQHLWTSDRERQ